MDLSQTERLDNIAPTISYFCSISPEKQNCLGSGKMVEPLSPFCSDRYVANYLVIFFFKLLNFCLDMYCFRFVSFLLMTKYLSAFGNG